MYSFKRTVYWDSCVFLHYIEGTKKWESALDSLLEEARQPGGVTIVTSTVTITEVAFAEAERKQRVADPAIEKAIDDLWRDRSVVKLVEFSEPIARIAQQLVRDGMLSQRGIKPMDAIHLATAINRKVSEFHTTEDPLTRWAAHVGFPIIEPYAPAPRLPGT